MSWKKDHTAGFITNEAHAESTLGAWLFPKERCKQTKKPR
jgi:hypothetical protein